MVLTKLFTIALLIGSISPVGHGIYFEEDGEYYDENGGVYYVTPEDSARILEIVSLGYNPYIAPEDDYSYGSVNNPGYWTEDGTFVSTRQAEAAAAVSYAPEGYVKIGSYYANLVYGTDQWIVDGAGQAATWVEGNTTIIADHAHQGFKVFTWSNIAEINGTTYTKVSQYNGYNDGSDIWLNDGRHISNCYDGSLAMYTCSDSTGDNVIVSYWVPSWETPAETYTTLQSMEAPRTEEVSQAQPANVNATANSHKTSSASEQQVHELTKHQKEHIQEKVMSLYENH